MKELSQFSSFVKTKDKEQKETGLTNCVIYTRVSTKEQEQGYSLETQLSEIHEFVRRKDWHIKGYFGGKFESAKTDERKEFNRMITYAKQSKEKINYIIVHKLDRFSRTGANAIYIAEQLRHENIRIIASSHPTDTYTPEGIMTQNMQFVISQYDNDLRRQRCMSGMREKLLKGYWVKQAPIGYDNKNPGRRKIPDYVINEKGELLKKAFDWKHAGMPQCDILKKLEELGFKLPKQTLNNILTNPFYCGLIVHTAIGNQVVEGNQPPIVSREKFLQIHDVLENKRKNPYKYQRNRPETPMTNFVKCPYCERHLTGYYVKKKKLYYYKCTKDGCKTHVSANKLHEQYIQIIKRYTVPTEQVEKISNDIQAYISQLQEEQQEKYKNQKAKLEDLNTKIEAIESRYIYGEIDREIYSRHIQKLREEKTQIEAELEKDRDKKSNYQKSIGKAIKNATELVKKWDFKYPIIQREEQKKVFPSGIYYDRIKDECRTDNINLLLAVSNRLLVSYNSPETKQASKNTCLSDLVVSTGIEPVSKV